MHIYDTHGSLVRTLVDGPMAVGYHPIVFNGKNDGGRDLGPGIYICRTVAEGFIACRSMVKGEWPAHQGMVKYKNKLDFFKIHIYNTQNALMAG